MDIQSRKIDFIQEFLKIQNEELISRLEKILLSNKSDESTLKPMSETEFNYRIDKSITDSNNNKTTSSDDLIVEIEKWR